MIGVSQRNEKGISSNETEIIVKNTFDLKVINTETQGQNEWEVMAMLLNQKYEIFPTEAQMERIVKFSRRSRSVWIVTPIATKLSYDNGSGNSLS